MVKSVSSKFVNVPRSSIVRKRLNLVLDNLRVPSGIIASKSNVSHARLSNFIKDSRDFNDSTLDKLEPTVNNYVKAYECLLKAEEVSNNG